MIGEEARHDPVGGNHQVFDQFRRAAALQLHEIAQRIVLEHRTRLDRRQRECAHLVAASFQRLRGAVLLAQVGLEPGNIGDLRRHRPFALEPRSEARVRELRAIAHDRLVYVRCAG